MKRITFLIVLAVCLNLALTALADNKLRVLTMEVETSPISVVPASSAPKKEVPDLVAVKETPALDEGSVDYCEQKIKLLEKYIELKSEEVKILQESLAHREGTIDQLERMVQ